MVTHFVCSRTLLPLCFQYETEFTRPFRNNVRIHNTTHDRSAVGHFVCYGRDIRSKPMPSPSFRLHLTLTKRQLLVLDKLSKKLLLDRSEVMRLALARLAEAEQIQP